MSKTVVDPTVESATLVDLLNWRAANQPDQPAYVFLADGETDEIPLTYQELDRQARAIAAWLQGMGAAGERVLLLFPPGLEYIAAFYGCLYAGAIAVPAYPPRLNRPVPRLQAIVADAQATLALTTSAIMANMERRFAHAPDLAVLRWLVTDHLPPGLEARWQPPVLQPNTLAFLQYTSGSTSMPKGVMLSHRNLLANTTLIHRGFDIDAESMGISWLPVYHDMGLVGGILEPLFAGRPMMLMSPTVFLQHPIRWLQAITRYRITIAGGPNFAYAMCVEKISPEQRTGLDLSCWKLAFCGAEPVRRETLERFAETFAGCGFRREAFYPCYGLAEATLFVSGGLGAQGLILQTVERAALAQHRIVPVANGHGGGQALVSCGQALLDQRIIIVDPESRVPCPADRIGEIWVAGPCVAQGYWNRPDETEHAFRAYLADTGEGPFLRTGDLGFMQNGQLFVTGRIKDLVIIRGRNLYPQDIEATVEGCHPALRLGAGAAFSIEGNGQEELVVVQEVDRQHLRHLAVDEVINTVRQAILDQHEVQAYAVVLVKPGSLPKTSSGKIQRHACRSGFLAGELSVVGQWAQPQTDGWLPEEPDLTDAGPAALMAGLTGLAGESEGVRQMQAWLITQLAQRLKMEPQAIDPQEQLGCYGLDSVMAVSLSGELEGLLGRRLPPTLLYDYPTVAALAAYLAGQPGGSPDDHHPDDQAPEGEELAEIPPEFYRFELYPQYRDVRRQIELAEALGIDNPYFKPHERVTNDTTVIWGRELINYSSYNYLGMSGDPAVSRAAKEAIDRYGTSVSASRLASGEKPLHRELEQALAELVRAEDCIVYVSGHATNVSTIGHLFGPNDLIMHDALIHNSAMQGCLLSGARRVPFPHNDWQALDDLLSRLRRRYERVLIVTEGVYSMDGDIPDLPRFIDIKKRHKAFLMVDEAHSIGTLGRHGRGIGEYFGVNAADVDLWMGTLSKSFASCGGYIAGSAALVEYLKYSSPGFVYSVGMSPPNTAAALAALRVLKVEPERVARLHARSDFFLTQARERGLDTGQSQDSPVVPIIVGDSLRAMRLAQALFERGINVQPMIYPAVENDAARLRFFITCTHTEAQIRFTLDTVREELARLNAGQVVNQ